MVDDSAMALSQPPDAVVTDLWMPGISGLQLCRLLRAEPGTATVPVVLLTASDDRRSRFWARHAGATAYVTKTEIDRLTDVLGDLTSSPKTRPPPAMHPQVVTRGNVQERLSQLLDASLFESTIAGEVRALSQKAEELEQLFGDLCTLASDIAGYRWLALTTDSAPAPHVKYKTRLFIHTHPDLKEVAEREARDALDVPPPPERRKPDEGDAFFITDKRAVEAEWSTAPILLPVRFGSVSMGQIALVPCEWLRSSRRRGVSRRPTRSPACSIAARSWSASRRRAPRATSSSSRSARCSSTSIISRR